MKLYHRVIFNRGTGLGNRLFPWARCVIAAAESDARMLAPHWSWPLRKGAIFTGGISRRAYLRQGLLLGVFQPRPEELHGAAALNVLLRHRESVQTFSGEENQFADVRGHREQLRAAFRASTRPRWRKLADDWRGPVMGINVRRGRDFQDATQPSDYHLRGALRTPLEWFVAMLRLARKVAGRELPAVVVSDGTASDLRVLLAEPGVRLLRPGCPASDLLVLSQTRLLLGSGGSSFSAWAAFLGEAPVFTIPGQALTWFGLDPTRAGACDPDAPSDDCVRACRELA